MNLKRKFTTVLAIFLFAGGNILNLYVSSNLLWGEMEARLFTQQASDRQLDIDCPLMIAAWETATIRTVVTNDLPEQATKPQVNAFIATESEPRIETQTLELGALESQSLQWTVDNSDIVFDRLILVSILQRPYRDLESRQGSCSIYVFSLLDMNGSDTLASVITTGVLVSLLGIGALYYSLRPLSEFATKVIQVNGIFLFLVLAGLFSALPRMWGLTLIFNAAALLVITVASVEIFFSRKS